MTAFASEALIAALTTLGDAVAVLAAGQVLASNEAAGALGDLVSLSQRALAHGGPLEVIDAGDGHEWEVRAVEVQGHVVVVARDASESAALRRSLARSDAILAVGSHELKGPLHVIGMICHLIETRAARGDAIDRATLDRLRRQVGRLNRLLNELLDASRVREGRLSLDLEDVDLIELLREQVAVAAASRVTDVTVALPPAAALRGDRARIGAVAFQLVDNAVRFTRPGTPIHLSLEATSRGFRLVVTDEGPGVPLDEAAQLFDREPRRGERGSQGLGLGLHVAAAVVRLHGGSIAYAPGAERGAVFTVNLPASASPGSGGPE